jgi:coenzyme F420-reducing hydrogenase gamma subunit
MKKLKVGLFSLPCCEGCELAIVELEERLLQAFDFLEIVESRMLREHVPEKQLDIAFVEGAVISDDDEQHIRGIRARSKFLVALGACAAIAGVPGIRNALPKALEEKFKRQAVKKVQGRVRALHEVVPVDFFLHGCSINPEEFFDLLNKVKHGAIPRLPNSPVCLECKQRSIPCLLLKGIACLGPVSNAGCNSLCPGENAQCIGCRGFTDDANHKSLADLFREFGMKQNEIENLFGYFNTVPDGVKK